MKLDTDTRFELARAELTVWVIRKAEALTGAGAHYPYGYKAIPDLAQPVNLVALREHWDYATKRKVPVPVLADHSEATIYLFPGANHAFRFWHDHVHIRLNRGFGLRDELAVAQDHQNEARDLSDDAKLLLWIDTALQAHHSYSFGGFVENQLPFAKLHFTRLTAE